MASRPQPPMYNEAEEVVSRSVVFPPTLTPEPTNNIASMSISIQSQTSAQRKKIVFSTVHIVIIKYFTGGTGQIIVVHCLDQQ